MLQAMRYDQVAPLGQAGVGARGQIPGFPRELGVVLT